MRHSTPSAGWVRALALTLVIGVACAEPRGGGDASGAQSTAAGRRAAPLPFRPDTLHSTITLEGMDEPMTFWLYRSPPTFPLPFSTYVPTDMAAEPVAADEADAVRFVAEFGGVRNEQAFLAVVALPDEYDRAAAQALARIVAQRYGVERVERAPDAPPRYRWSLEEWNFQRELPGGGTAIGTGALGRHGGRYYYVVTHFPEEYADGFGPRATRILDEWRWEDTGEGLGGPAGGG